MRTIISAFVSLLFINSIREFTVYRLYINNHQNTFLHQFENFSSDTKRSSRKVKTSLAVLGVNLKNAQISKICHFVNHFYLSAKKTTHCKDT